MEKAKEKGEIMSNAMRLIQSKGDEALEYAKKQAEKPPEPGKEKDQEFWEKIYKQVELLLHQE